MSDKKKDCQYCGGSGFRPSNLIARDACGHCKGSGEVNIQENRKSVLISVSTHKILKDMAHERKMTFVEYVTYLIRKDKIKFHFERRFK